MKHDSTTPEFAFPQKIKFTGSTWTKDCSHFRLGLVKGLGGVVQSGDFVVYGQNSDCPNETSSTLA
jgi:hypothetical protein